MPSAPAFDRDSGIARRVLNAQTVMLFQRSLTASVFGLVLALLVAWGVRPYAAANLIGSWFALRCIVMLVRLSARHLFFRSTRREEPVWRRLFFALAAFDGISWGLLAWMLAPQGAPHLTAVLLTTLVGFAAVGVFVLQASWRASVVFLAAMLLPVLLNPMVEGEPLGAFIGLGLAIFVGVLLKEAHGTEKRIRELLYLRFNTDRISEERAEALRLAQRQSSVKGQFLATMSHEMRTPLHGILGLTRMLKAEHAGKTEPPYERLELIERAGEHLLTLINDILDFSKLEAGQVRLSPQVFDLAALIDDVVSLAIPSAFQAGLTLTARLQMPRPCHVRGDPARVRQVLHNLVGNAIKFTEEGSVTVIAKYHVDRTRIAVHDTGAGIAPADLTHIFDAFRQADNSFTRRYSGTGLGLTIARELARAMGGDLVCTSRQGRGSCFTMTVRLPSAPLPDPAHFATPDVKTITFPPLRGRVLLAEDNPVNALVAEAALRNMGFSVEVVEDGLQALASFRTQPPDLVLMDCQMPVMDGFEAARRMREHESELNLSRTPVVALTANALEGDREHSLAAGMDDHIAKPFREAQLRAVLQRLMDATP